MTYPGQRTFQPYARVDELTRFIIDEIFITLRQSPRSWTRRLLGPLLKLPARRFATLMSELDRRVAEEGMTAAAQWMSTQIVAGIEAFGTARIPREGPLLVAANHPGAYDVVAIVASLGRDDVKIIVSGVPFTRALIATAPHLIYVTPDNLDAPDRMTAIRKCIRHLQDNGALLIYPSGIVDPDPDMSSGLEESLSTWSGSLEILLRRAPPTRLMPTIVSGVLSQRYLNHPLVKIPNTVWEKRKLAEMIQVSCQMLANRPIDLRPRVTFGEAVSAEELRDATGHYRPMIIARARQALAEHMSERCRSE